MCSQVKTIPRVVADHRKSWMNAARALDRVTMELITEKFTRGWVAVKKMKKTLSRNLEH